MLHLGTITLRRRDQRQSDGKIRILGKEPRPGSSPITCLGASSQGKQPAAEVAHRLMVEGIEIKRDYDADLPTIQADPDEAISAVQVAGATGVSVASWKFTASNEGIKISKIKTFL